MKSIFLILLFLAPWSGALDVTIPPVAHFDRIFPVTVSNGIPPYSYSWINDKDGSVGGMQLPLQAYPSFIPQPGYNTPMNFTLTVTDSAAAMATATILIDMIFFAPAILDFDYCHPTVLNYPVDGGILPLTVIYYLQTPLNAEILNGNELRLSLEQPWTGTKLMINVTDAIGLTQILAYGLDTWTPQEWNWNCSTGEIWRFGSNTYSVEPQPIAATVRDRCGNLLSAPSTGCPTSSTSTTTTSTSTTTSTTTSVSQNTTLQPLITIYNLSEISITVITDTLTEVDPQGSIVRSCNLTQLEWNTTEFARADSRIVLAEAWFEETYLLFNTTFYSNSTKYSYFVTNWPFVSMENVLILRTRYRGPTEYSVHRNTTELKTKFYSVEFAPLAALDGENQRISVHINASDDEIISEVIFSAFNATLDYDPLFSLLLLSSDSKGFTGLNIIVAASVAGGCILAVIVLAYTEPGHKLLLGMESWRVHELRRAIQIGSLDNPAESAPRTEPVQTQEEWV